MSETRPQTRAEATQVQRRRRQDSGPTQTLNLHIPDSMKEPGFEYHWFNDAGGRIHNKTQLDDWDVVTKDVDGRKEPVTRLVDKTPRSGEPLRAVLCRKPKDYQDADRAKAMGRIKDQEDSIMRGVVQDPTGRTNQTGAYVPAGGISIKRG